MKQILRLILVIIAIASFSSIEIIADSNVKKEIKALKKEYAQRQKEYKKLIKYGVPDNVLQREDEELAKLQEQIEELEGNDSSSKKEKTPLSAAKRALVDTSSSPSKIENYAINEPIVDASVDIRQDNSSEPKKTNPNEEITLTVSSDGATKDDALKKALRTAIEQAYGAFVSANTTILNDELVKDEIVTVSNGSIKDYKEISSFEKPDGNGYMMTVNATVSLPHLITYAKNHGSECEFAGNTFMLNTKLKKLYKDNEIKALNNLYAIICEILPTIYDYNLTITDEPFELSEHYMFKSKIIAKLNSNSQALWEIINQNISELSLEPNLEGKNSIRTDNLFVMSYKNKRFYPSGLLFKRYGLGDSGPFGYDNSSYPSQNSDILCVGFLRTNTRELLEKIAGLIETTITSVNIVSNIGDNFEHRLETSGSIGKIRHHSNPHSDIVPDIPETIEMSCIFYVPKDKLSQISSFKVVPKR